MAPRKRRTTVCDPLEAATPSGQHEPAAADRPGMSRRRVLGTMGAASAGLFAFADLVGRPGLAQAAPQDTDTSGASVILLGTNGGPPPLAARYGISSALVVNGKDKVDLLHKKALSLGATDEGAPGPRGEGFYAGYFRDLDGNKLNAFVMG